jgi:predicted ester cyclase
MGTLPTPQRMAETVVGEVDIETIARTVYQSFNARRLDEAALWVDDDCEWLDVPSGAVFHGPDGYLAFDSGWLRAFPDAHLEVSNVIANGDLVATEFIARGTHEGPLTNPDGEILAATGKSVELRCIEVLQIRGAKIVRARFYYDALSMLRRLGVLR